MYVISKQVRAENGSTLGTFSCHGAALTAMYRQWNPDYQPLNRINKQEDLEEEERMQAVIESLMAYGMEVV